MSARVPWAGLGVLVLALLAGVAVVLAQESEEGVDIAARTGVEFTKTVATFETSEGGVVYDAFSATIDWGDGVAGDEGVIVETTGTRPSCPGTTAQQCWAVRGTHTYTDAGKYQVVVELFNADKDEHFFTVSPLATVRDYAGVDVSATAGEEFSGPTASFTDPGGTTAADFSASIDWGDGTPSSAGTISPVASGYEVAGKHTYAAAGSFTVETTISGSGGSEVVTATATVAEGPGPGPTAGPDTVITSAPAARVTAASATISFRATEAGARFECALDGAPFTACSSPAEVTAETEGSHVFAVRAISDRGRDATPALATWTLLSNLPRERLGRRAGARKLMVPRALPDQQIDARCGDNVYGLATQVRLGQRTRRPRALVWHSGTHLYVCVRSLPKRTRRVSVQVDPRRHRSGRGRTGVFSVTLDRRGKLRASKGTVRGGLIRARAVGDDVAGERKGGVAELRIALERVGGYSRTGRARIAISPSRLGRWPRRSTTGRRASWGRLRLGPIYPRSVRAGSVFVDGSAGYLVVPQAPKLSPKTGTIAAWVRVAGNGCGTILGNNRLRSYWLAVCGQLEFSENGRARPLRGIATVGHGWHHLAVTVDSDGERTLFVDGQVDITENRPPRRRVLRRDQKTEPNPRPSRLGRGPGELRIGSDASDLPQAGGLHGYLQGLTIWRRPLRRSEIRRIATRGPRRSDRRRGLVGWWPLRRGLADRVGGNDAGLVGSASLARARPPRRLPRASRGSPSLGTSRSSGPGPWDGKVPLLDREPVVDGHCPPVEYLGAAAVPLEASRDAAPFLMLTEEALYICAPPLFGSGRADALTLWIARDGAARKRPGANDLRLRLGADGRLRTSVGDGRAFVTQRLPGIESRLGRDRIWGFQDDMDDVRAPWFSGEVKIPMASLAPFTPGSPLRMGLLYEGSLRRAAIPQLRPGARFGAPRGSLPSPRSLTNGRWPAALRKDDTQTLAAVASVDASSERPLVGSAIPAGTTTGARAAGRAHSAFTTTASYWKACPNYTGLNRPLMLQYVYNPFRKWPPIGGSYHAETGPFAGKSTAQGLIVRSEGRLLPGHAGIHVSAFDSGHIHDSHDLDMKLAVTPESREYVLDGKDVQVLEVETLAVPPHGGLTAFPPPGSEFLLPKDAEVVVLPDDRQARPTGGDHVIAEGLWVYDCGHAPKTELHPIFVMESDRQTAYRGPGGSPIGVTDARVWFNREPSPYWSSDDKLLGHFEFRLDLAKGFDDLFGVPFMRVLEGDPDRVSHDLNDASVEVTMPPGQTTYLTRMIKGYAANRLAGTGPLGATAETRVHLDKITIKDDSDHCTGGDRGEWYMAANLEGTWRQIFWGAKLDGGGKSYPLDVSLAGVGYYVRPWLQITAYEQDPTNTEGCTGQVPELHDAGEGGDELPSPVVSVKAGKLVIDNDWYRLTGTVTEAPLPSALGDDLVWANWLKDEPNDVVATELGVLGGDDILVRERRIVEAGGYYSNGETRLLSSDTDRYRFDVDDFVDIDLGELPSELRPLEQGSTYLPRYDLPGEPLPSARECHRTLLGAQGGELRVQSKSGSAGNVPYTLQIGTTPRSVPGDWGEPLEGGTTSQSCRQTPPSKPGFAFRPVDLTEDATPDSRKLTGTRPTAWQHDYDDVDAYDIAFPEGAKPVPNTSCKYDKAPTLKVRAKGMAIALYEKGPGISLGQTGTPPFATGKDEVVAAVGSIGDPRHIVAFVAHPSGSRGAYRLQVDWDKGVYYDKAGCKLVTNDHRIREFNFTKWFVEPTFDFPPEPPDPTFLTQPSLTEPVEIAMSVFAPGGFQQIKPGASKLDAVVSAASGDIASVRVYDRAGVLVGESIPITNDSQIGEADVPGEMTAQARLTIGGLVPNRSYLLQVVPTPGGELAEGAQSTLGGSTEVAFSPAGG